MIVGSAEGLASFATSALALDTMRHLEARSGARQSDEERVGSAEGLASFATSVDCLFQIRRQGGASDDAGLVPELGGKNLYRVPEGLVELGFS